MTVTFSASLASAADARQYGEAAAGNIAAAGSSIKSLSDVLRAAAGYDKILLRAAAGAGKSYALVRMVKEALDRRHCSRRRHRLRRQASFPLAERLGAELGTQRVCLFVAQDRRSEIPRG